MASGLEYLGSKVGCSFRWGSLCCLLGRSISEVETQLLYATRWHLNVILNKLKGSTVPQSKGSQDSCVFDVTFCSLTFAPKGFPLLLVIWNILFETESLYSAHRKEMIHGWISGEECRYCVGRLNVPGHWKNEQVLSWPVWDAVQPQPTYSGLRAGVTREVR